MIKDGVEWRSVDELLPGPWGTTAITAAEERALTRSLRHYGWLLPLLITSERAIVDGFKRHSILMLNKPLRKHLGDFVPTVVVQGIETDNDARLLALTLQTVRGDRVARLMSETVSLLTKDFSNEEISLATGLHRKTVEVLRKPNLFSLRSYDAYRYNRAWYPTEA